MATPAKKPLKKAPVSTLPPGVDRLERALAHAGHASRREAKALILAGKVQVNNKVVTDTGFRVTIGKDVLIVDGQHKETKVAYLFHKPRGVETEKINTTFSSLKDLAPIGRLDKDSEGLIIVSNDGTLTRALTRVGTTVGKHYSVVVRENITDNDLARMATGIILDKVKTKPATVKRLSRHSFTIELHEGRKHQIRRMCDACHLTIDSLVRTAIGHLTMGSMKPGQYKKLTDADLAALRSL